MKIPDVTLMVVETRQHRLARMAADECLKRCEFGDVVICSDKFSDLKVPGARLVTVDDWSDKRSCQEFVYQKTADLIKTSHVLLIEWDAWVIDAGMWRDDYLKYDYIGAPWWHTRDAVGNGGFSLRSQRFLQHLTDNADKYPISTGATDDLICRQYRRGLERAGLVWADFETALDFSFERVRKSADQKHFGFHGTFNWPWVMGAAQLRNRSKMLTSSYHANSGMVSELRRMTVARAGGHFAWFPAEAMCCTAT